MTLERPTLFPVFTVHCFWLRCAHVVQGPDPLYNQRAMNRHYHDAHPEDLTKLGYTGQKAELA